MTQDEAFRRIAYREEGGTVKAQLEYTIIIPVEGDEETITQQHQANKDRLVADGWTVQDSDIDWIDYTGRR